MSFFAFPEPHWLHLRRTNIVESSFAVVRLRTHGRQALQKVANATALIWKVLCVAEKTFRRLNAPELLPAVCGRGTTRGRSSSQQRAVEGRRLTPFTHQSG